MSVLKMKFISIVGLKDYFEDFVFNYIIDSGIQLENALNFLENVKGLSHFTDENPYGDLLRRSTNIINLMGLEKETRENVGIRAGNMALVSEIRDQICELEKNLQEYTSKQEKIKEQLNNYGHMQKQLELLRGLDVDIDTFFNFEFIKFRFGRMPEKSYKQLQLYLEDLEAIVIPVSQDQDYIWMIYFTPRAFWEKVDGIFSSLYFERVRISGEAKGTPVQALEQLEEKINRLQEELEQLNRKLKDLIKTEKDKAIRLYHYSVRLHRITEVKKYAAQTSESFYIIGWMPEEDLKALIPVLKSDNRIIFIEEEPDVIKTIKPPTELRNNKIFKPFESLVRMYGLPSYNEIDPTAFVAITYFIMFGMMFGDVGQGAVLLAGGMLLVKLKIALGGVIFGAGLSSIIFGFLYGSVFGFEDWLSPLWLHPLENINTMLTVGVAMGIALITVAMILNIINGIKSRNLAKIFLDRNGVAGFVFYWGVVISALYFFMTQELPFSLGILTLILIVPIIGIFFKEPVENYLHRRKAFPSGKGMFCVQTFFELFDTVLSFASNTISFIRLSAFALNHAGLFMAIFILAGMAKGVGSIIEIVIGNILIVVLEGLIVGIQALRLEYYELFSRFFSGEGRPYRPLKNEYYT